MNSSMASRMASPPGARPRQGSTPGRGSQVECTGGRPGGDPLSLTLAGARPHPQGPPDRHATICRADRSCFPILGEVARGDAGGTLVAVFSSFATKRSPRSPGGKRAVMSVSTILLVEEEELGQALRQALGREGWVVVGARS